jgi:hypothetical protein
MPSMHWIQGGTCKQRTAGLYYGRPHDTTVILVTRLRDLFGPLIYLAR